MAAPVSYIDIQYLATYGLFKANALEYFYTSPFFDPNSNNERVRKQGLHPSKHLEILETMTGTEYVLDEHNTCEPNLFVFRKQNRLSPKRSELVDVYYCTDGIIYQSPDFLNLLKTRMAKTSYYLEQSFETCRRSVGWVDATSGKKRKNGFLCWQQQQQQQPPLLKSQSMDIAQSDDTEASVSSPQGQEQVDTFHTLTRARSKAAKKYERLVRDLPTFKSVLEDVRLS